MPAMAMWSESDYRLKQADRIESSPREPREMFSLSRFNPPRPAGFSR